MPRQFFYRKTCDSMGKLHASPLPAVRKFPVFRAGIPARGSGNSRTKRWKFPHAVLEILARRPQRHRDLPRSAVHGAVPKMWTTPRVGCPLAPDGQAAGEACEAIPTVSPAAGWMDDHCPRAANQPSAAADCDPHAKGPLDEPAHDRGGSRTSSSFSL